VDPTLIDLDISVSTLEKLVAEIEKFPNAKSIQGLNIRKMIISTQHLIYNSAIKTFIAAMTSTENSHLFSYSQMQILNPFYSKWLKITNLYKLNEYYFKDFKNDLLENSKLVPEIFSNSTLYDFFINQIWSQLIPYEERAEKEIEKLKKYI